MSTPAAPGFICKICGKPKYMVHTDPADLLDCCSCKSFKSLDAFAALELPASAEPPREIAVDSGYGISDPIPLPPTPAQRKLPRRYRQMLDTLSTALAAIEQTGQAQVLLGFVDEQCAKNKRFEFYKARAAALSPALDDLAFSIVNTTKGWGIKIQLAHKELVIENFVSEET